MMLTLHYSKFLLFVSHLFFINLAVEEIVREWWNYDLLSKNQADFMEQDALWYMLEVRIVAHNVVDIECIFALEFTYAEVE